MIDDDLRRRAIAVACSIRSSFLQFNRVWELSERLCDFWVAADCMACTASILNLVGQRHWSTFLQRNEWFLSFRFL